MSDWLPDAADTRSLGSTSREWLNVYLGDAGKMYFGLGQNVSLEYDSSNIAVLIRGNLRVLRDGAFTQLIVGGETAGTEGVISFRRAASNLSATMDFKTAGSLIWSLGLQYDKGDSLCFRDFITAGYPVLIQLDANTIKIATATSQLLGFYGVTPVNQPDTVSDASDLATCITAINAIIDRLQELGLIA